MPRLPALLVLTLAVPALAGPKPARRLAPKAIADGMAPIQDELAGCDKDAHGSEKLELTITIAASGKVTSVGFAPAPAAAVARCLTTTVMKVKFPVFDGAPQVVKWPIELHAQVEPKAAEKAGEAKEEHKAHEAAPAPAKIPETLSPGQIGPRVSANRAGILACAKGQPGHGGITILITIAPTGTVASVKVTPKLDNDAVDCVKKLMTSIKFPEFKGKPVTARFQYKL